MTERGPGDFEEFVRLKSGKLLRFAFWMTGNWEDAQDAVQETLAKAYLVWARIEQPDPYVHRMLINLIRRSYRAGCRELVVADPPEDGAADPNLESITARTVLAAALRSLPRRQRAVVVLRYCLDLPVVDVASLLHCSEGTVKSQSSKALAKLGSDPTLSGMG